MKATHIKALEMQARWLRWTIEEGPTAWDGIVTENPSYALALYKQPLKSGDSLYMSEQFCDLVDHARRSVPDDLAFEESWMVTPTGFMWLEKPFLTPTPIAHDPRSQKLLAEVDNKFGISAVGWMKLESGGYHIMFYQAYDWYRKGVEGYGCWTHLTLREGDRVLDRLREFEMNMMIRNKEQNDPYSGDRESEILHELRWAYAAFHLMAQRLSHIREEKTSSLVRSMAHKKRLALSPILKIVSLRRMEEDRPVSHRDVEWQWQWTVGGHWRKQPYKTTGEIKNIFIESYIKGPSDKPVKPPAHTLFLVGR